MQRLAELVLHIVGDIHNVVDRLQANALQPLLQPCRGWTHLHAGKRNACIPRAAKRVADLHWNKARSIVLRKRIHIWPKHLGLASIAHIQRCQQIPSDTDVAHGIGTVRG